MANIMDKFTKTLEEKLMPIAAKVANQRHLAAIRDGIIITLPFIIVGSIFLILANLPIPALNEFYATELGGTIQKWISYPVSVTFGLIAVITCMGIGYRLSNSYKVDGISGAIFSLVSFLLVTPFEIVFKHEQYGELSTSGIPLGLMGSSGLFVAMIMAIISVEIRFQKVLLTKIIRIGFESTSFKSIHNVATIILTKPLTAVGGSYFGLMVITLLIHLLWTCGLHGANIVLGIVDPALYVLMDQNRVAFEQGLRGTQLPNVVTRQFFDVFQSMGGSGATFSLVIMMLLWSKSKQLKEIGKLSIGPGLFNINEPILFGLPIVMNPLLIIPFILSPLATVTITYWAMKVGWVARPTGIAIPWTTPPFISGWLVTGHISGAIIQLVTFFVTGIIYYPFFKMWDNKKLEEERASEMAE